MVFEGPETDVFVRKKLQQFAVPLGGVGFKVMVGADLGDGVFFQNLGPDLERLPVENSQRRAEGGEAVVQLRDGLLEEGDAGVVAGKLVEDVGVEDEDRQHRPPCTEGVVEARVVVEAQVAAEPEEGEFGHGRTVSGEGAGRCRNSAQCWQKQKIEQRAAAGCLLFA